MSFRGYNRTFEIQRLAPTERGGRAHAAVRDALTVEIGHVAIETMSGQNLGLAEVGEGQKTARLFVVSNGLGGSGCPVFTPAVLVIPENTDRAPGLT